MQVVKKIKYIVVLVITIVITSSSSLHYKKGKAGGIKVIVIDPGHGGKDPGCNGSFHKEKDVSLAVALKLGKLIEENYKDVKVIFTRTTDVFVELEDRAQIANKAKADLFISIHCNAAGKPVIIKDPKTGKKKKKTYKNKKGKIVVVEKPNPEPFGTETYVMGTKNEEGKMKVAQRENSAIFLEDNYEKKYEGFDPDSPESYIIMSNYTSAYVLQSASLAVKIQEEYTKKAGRIDKGVHRQSIWVLWRTAMPSILTEIGYLTNPLEEKFLGSVEGQDYLAKAIFRGLRKYKDEVEGTKKEYTDEIENQKPLENENVKAGNIPGQRKAVDEDDMDDEEAEKAKAKKDSLKTTDKTTDVKAVKMDSVKTKLVSTSTLTSEEKTTEVKTEAETKVKEDEKFDAKSIAEKFKEKNNNTVNTSTTTNVLVSNKEKEIKHKQDSISKLEIKKSNELNNEDKIFFKVQFASSDVQLNLKQEKFASIIEGDYYKDKNILKYTSGNFLKLSDATNHQNQLREKGFKDCFVIALRNGKRIDLNEARSLVK